MNVFRGSTWQLGVSCELSWPFFFLRFLAVSANSFDVFTFFLSKCLLLLAHDFWRYDLWGGAQRILTQNDPTYSVKHRSGHTPNWLRWILGFAKESFRIKGEKVCIGVLYIKSVQKRCLEKLPMFWRSFRTGTSGEMMLNWNDPGRLRSL